MTVCIAAICEDASVVGASDRMITSGDVKFEPQQSKSFALTNSIAVMTAGDAALQAEIIRDVQFDVFRRIAADPSNWWAVRDVAALFSHHYNRARLKRAENAILAPLGLTASTFIGLQRQMNTELVRRLASDMINFQPPHVSAIFAGVDLEGPHIYVANNGNVTCEDSVGFAVIGSGSWHADSQFMFAGHTRARAFPATLLLTYSAKKHSEVAPGVGEGTDMFYVGPNVGSHVTIGEHVLENLQAIYDDAQRAMGNILLEAERRAERYVEVITAAATSEPQSAPPPGTSLVPDEEDGTARTGAAPED